MFINVHFYPSFQYISLLFKKLRLLQHQCSKNDFDLEIYALMMIQNMSEISMKKVNVENLGLKFIFKRTS